MENFLFPTGPKCPTVASSIDLHVIGARKSLKREQTEEERTLRVQMEGDRNKRLRMFALYVLYFIKGVKISHW